MVQLLPRALALLAASSVMSTVAAAAAAAAAPMDVILTFGDSLTQTWDEGSLNQRLAYSYCRKLDVVGRGFGGYNTEWALPILEQILPNISSPIASRIQLMTIWFGANDACLPPSPQFLPIPRFKDNLKKMVAHVRTHSPSTALILITPPPIHGPTRAALLAPNPLDRSQDNTRAYAAAVQEVGSELQVVTLDLFGAVERAVGGDLEGKGKALFRDGLHFNKDGYQILYDALQALIKTHFPQLEPDALQPVWPLWADINFDDVAGSVRPRTRDEL